MISAAATQSTGDVNAYWIALIAVLGTCVGAAISATTQIVTNRRSASIQQTAVERQLDHSTQEAIRQDRRTAYARFLRASNAWNRLYIEYYLAKMNKRSTPDIIEAQEELIAAHMGVSLLAGPEVSELAYRIFNQDLHSMSRARQGLNPDFGHPRGFAFPAQLQNAMKMELGIRWISLEIELDDHDYHGRARRFRAKF